MSSARHLTLCTDKSAEQGKYRGDLKVNTDKLFVHSRLLRKQSSSALPFLHIHYGISYRSCIAHLIYSCLEYRTGLERIRLLRIALHSAIRSTIILAVLFTIQIAILIALAIRLHSNTLSIVLSTHSTR